MGDVIKKVPLIDVDKTYDVIDINTVFENTWNPNIVPDTDFLKLKESIQETGGNQDQPVMVRPHPTKDGMYEIVDGAHRYRAMYDLGFNEIVVIIKEMDDKEARLKTIAMNKFRGDFDSVQLAGLLSDLKTNYSVTEEELEGYLGYTQEELKGYDSLVEFDFDDYGEELPENIISDDDLKDIPEQITLQLTPKQKIAVEKLTVLTNLTDLSEAISLVAEYYALKESKGDIDTDLLKEAAGNLQ